MQIPDEKPSKTRRKRDMHELQALGESLVELDDHEIDRLPIDERLADAVREARTIRSREGRRRQLQFIGRLMRDVDADALRSALAEIRR
jgi:ribosome-associated protein